MRYAFNGPLKEYEYKTRTKLTKATITRCDLSPRFFCIDATLLSKFENDKI